MKSLVEYINESANIEFLRFSINGLDLVDNFWDKMEAAHNKTDIYFEKTDAGFKLKIKPGQEANVQEYVDLLNAVIEKNVNGDDAESKKSAIENLEAEINKLQNLAIDGQGAKEEPKDEEEPKKEEE